MGFSNRRAQPKHVVAEPQLPNPISQQEKRKSTERRPAFHWRPGERFSGNGYGNRDGAKSHMRQSQLLNPIF